MIFKIIMALTALMAPLAWAQSPLEIKGVAVTISGTSGFARDVALEQAAKQALPQVLQGPSFQLTAAEAKAKTKAVGSAMPFVAKYKIVKESVLPTYALVADLTFSEPLLRKNFGGVKTETQATEAPKIEAKPATESQETPSSSNRTTYVVRVPDPTPAGQDRARRALKALPQTTVLLRLISVQGVELTVTSAQPEEALKGALSAWPTADWRVQTASVETPATPAPEAMPARASDPAATPTSAPARRNLPAWMPDLW